MRFTGGPNPDAIGRRVAAYGVAIVPFVVAAVRALANDWFPIGDAAQLYIRATDVLTRNHPWIGSGSSASTSLGFQVNNAGPLYYDLIGPFARLLPPGPGAVLGVTAVNVACLVLAGLAARRVGGAQHGATFELWVLAACAVLAWTMGSELLFDMFQAHALLFPWLAACVLLAGAALGQRWVWPWLAFVLTLIVHTHLSYAYILPTLVAAAVVTAVVRLPAPRRDRVRAWPADRGVRRTAGWTALVLAVTWFQPVFEQIFGDGQGNLVRLARASRGTDVTLGGGNAVRLTAAFIALPPWAGRQGFADTIAPSGITTLPDRREVVELAGMPATWLAAVALAVTLALLGGAWWWAGRRAIAPLQALATLALVGVVGSVVALSRLTVTVLGFAPHHTRWIIVVSLLVYVTLAWATTDAIRSRRRGSQVVELVETTEGDVPPVVSTGSTTSGRLVPLLVLVVFSLLNLPRFAQAHGPTADEQARPALRAMFAELDATTFAGPVYFDLANERVYAPHTSAIQLHLRERGIDFRVDSEFLVRHLGERRRADGTEPTTLTQFHDDAAESPPATGCVVLQVPPTGTSPGWPSMWLAVTLSGPGACP
ncbi:MAG TPA: hypothetical protein VNQ73_16915 [Ilumatobacter sp.]|nr:hypothetical protein [Ilumatobacter sp.]